jgi:hypothetical protein
VGLGRTVAEAVAWARRTVGAGLARGVAVALTPEVGDGEPRTVAVGNGLCAAARGRGVAVGEAAPGGQLAI